MKNKNILLSVIVSVVILNTSINAETTELETVDVWGTEVISSSLDEISIETKQADHLSDLLRDIPGVDVGGTHSINNRINIRGLQDENLDITLDGVKIQNANMFHHIGNLLINPDILKKADIQVGTNSIVSGSLGGSVAFETKEGKEMLDNRKKFGGRISTTYNSNDSLGGSISTYGQVSKNIDFLLYHNYLDKNNWEDGDGTKTFGVDGTVNNTLVKFGVDLSDTQRISLSYDRLMDEGDYAPRPDFGREYNEARTSLDTFPTEYLRETITLKHKINLGDNLLLNTTIFSNENELERYEGPLSSGKPVRPPFGITTPGTNLEGKLKGTVKIIGINIKAQSNIESGAMLHVLTYGGLYDKQTSKVTWDGVKYGDNEEAKSLAFFIEDAIDFDNGLVLTPGIRFNKYELDGAYGKIDDDKITFGLSGEYFVNDDLTLLASGTTLYKGVEMVDVLAANRIVVEDNTDLKSETGINKEFGFRYIKSSILGADDIGFSFKYFQTTIKDYIDQKWNAMSNMGNLDIDGFESSFVYNKGALKSLITYAHSNSKFEQTKESLVQEPGDSISLALHYQINKNIDLAWESLVVLKEDDIPSSSGGQYADKKSYNIHDIAFKYQPKNIKGLSAVVGIDNIFDKYYSSHISENRYFEGFGYTTDYEPGRNIKVTLAYKF